MIWYQGENNVRNVAGSVANKTGYACQMASMIADWRAIWSAIPGTTAATFPFGVTQLAGSCSEGFPANTGAFRRSQTGGYGTLPNAAMPNTFLGQAFDLGDPWQPGCRKTGACFGWDAPFSENRTHNYENSAIHPRPKEPLGGRLARAAIAQHYTKGTPLLPVLASCTSEGGADSGGAGRPIGLELSFSGLGGAGLAEPTFSPRWPGASAVELKIDGNWTFIETIGLELSRVSPEKIGLQLPAAGVVSGLRYAWSDNPCCGGSNLGGNNRTVDACPPMACPLLTAGALPEPVVPFLARLENGANGALVCVCDAPMVC